MILNDVMNVLARGELRNLAIGGDGTGVIPEKHYATIIDFINLGLTDLHTRFPLKTKEVVIDQNDGIQIYHLTRQFAQSNTSSTEDIKYIADTAENPFLEDIIRIENAYDETGKEIFLNDYSMPGSIFTPTYNSVQIVNPVSENSTFFIYRANHPFISSNITVRDKVVLDLPYTFLEALCLYVGYKAYSNKSGNEGQGMMSTYRLKYENACAFLLEHNAANDSYTVTNAKPAQNYWP